MARSKKVKKHKTVGGLLGDVVMYSVIIGALACAIISGTVIIDKFWNHEEICTVTSAKTYQYSSSSRGGVGRGEGVDVSSSDCGDFAAKGRQMNLTNKEMVYIMKPGTKFRCTFGNIQLPFFTRSVESIELIDS